jgi:predicted alpha/beta-fold hydrolase
VWQPKIDMPPELSPNTLQGNTAFKNAASIDPFHPRRGLRRAHLQTLAGQFLPRTFVLSVPEEQLFQVENGVQVLCRCHWQADRRNALTVLIVHGLEGSSESPYVLGTTAKAFAAGMNVVRMNMRNCGGTESLGPSLYHSGMSGDVGAVARALVSANNLSNLALVGFSMGGNLVLKLAGELGREAAPQLCAVASVSPAVDLGASADALHQRENRLYERYFLWLLKRRIRRKSRLYPGQYELARLHGLRSLREFDDRITAHYCGFRGASDYYSQSSASRVLDRIGVPTLVIHAKDDPFIRILPDTEDKLRANPLIQYLETDHGGHCGFIANPDGYDGHWAERAVIQFITAFNS